MTTLLSSLSGSQTSPGKSCHSVAGDSCQASLSGNPAALAQALSDIPAVKHRAGAP